MPYKESPYFETPCHTKTLWRFMHIDKFMSMINKQLLHFPNITLFQDKDKYEGELSDKSRTTVYETNLLDEKNTPIKRDEAFQQNKTMIDDQTESIGKKQLLSLNHSFDILLTRFSKHLMFCNCWFLNDNESHTMWAEYGDKSPTSVAIQTTVGDLIDSFESTDFDIHIGKVEYKDYDTEHIEGFEHFTSKDLTDPYNVLGLFYAPIIHKRNIYAGKHEVRAVISFESICEHFLDRIYTSKIPFYSNEIISINGGFSYTNRIDDQGTVRKIDNVLEIDAYLDLLIKTVVMSPYMNGYFDAPLRKLMDDNSLNGGLVRVSRIQEVLEKNIT